MSVNPLDQPTAYIIAGPNGAGKTTFSMHYLPEHANCLEFLNADLIAAGLAPLAPHTQNVTAGKLLLRRITELSTRRVNFAFETTLSGRSWLKTITKLQSLGYRITLHFLWLPAPSMALSRVANRVAQGGHFIPDDVVVRRYHAGLYNFANLYRSRVDNWLLYNAAPQKPQRIAQSLSGKMAIIDDALYAQVMNATRSKKDETKK